MSHRSAPLTPTGTAAADHRCQIRSIAHVAAEAGVSRQCLSKWVHRYRRHREPGLEEAQRQDVVLMTCRCLS